MKFNIDFEKYPDFVYVWTDGEATPEGFEQLLSAIANSPNWRTGCKQLVDHRKLNAQNIEFNDIQKIVKSVIKYQKNIGTGKCAFVINNDLGFGLVRMYEQLGGENVHQEMAVFYNLEEAITWLKA